VNPNKTIYSSLFKLAPPSHNCQFVEIVGTKIFAGCISTLENNIQLCKVDYLENNISECISYNFDYGLQEGEEIKDEKIFMQYFQTPLGHDRFIFNFKSSQLVSLRNKFFIISEKGNYSISIPIQGVILNRIQILKCDEMKNKMELLMSLKNGNKFDLVSFKLKNFIIDKESLRDGLLREMVEWFDWGSNSLVIYEKQTGQNPSLNVILLDMDDLTQKKYVLQGKNDLVLKQFSQGFIFLRLQNLHYGLQDYFINTFSNRFCMFNVPFKSSDAWLSFVTFDHIQHIFLFDFKDKFTFSAALFPKFESIEISFDEDQDATEWEREDDLGQKYIEAKASFKSQGELVYEVDIKIVDDYFIKRGIDGSTIVNRLSNIVPYHLDIERNNLPLDLDDPSVFYFNQIDFFEDELLNYLKEHPIATLFVTKNIHFVSLNMELISVNYRQGLKKYASAPLGISIKKMLGFNINEFKNFESIEFTMIMFKFMLVMIDQERLFYLDIEDIYTSSDSILIKEIQLPTNKKCLLKKTLLICYFPNDENLNNQVFYKFEVIEKLLRYTAVSTFIPDLSHLLNENSFYYSRFNDGFFTLLVRDSNSNALIVQSDPKKIIGVYKLPFLADNMTDQIDFYQIVKEIQLVVDYSKSLEIWICHGDQILSYPAQGFLEDFDEYVQTFYKTGLSTFAVMYRTKSGSLRLLVYKLSTSANNRLIKEFMIDQDGCADKDINLRIHNPYEFIYLVYYCNDPQKISVFKYSNKIGVNLILSKDKDIFSVNTGESSNQIFKHENLEYSNHIEASIKKVKIEENKIKVETVDLEENGLSLSGDIARAEINPEKEDVKFIERIQLESVENLKHQISLHQNNLLRFSLNDDQVSIVSDEYILKDKDIQNNNFYRNCMKPKFIILSKNFNKFKNIYLCQSRETLKMFITDFLSIKMRIRIGERKLVKPNLIVKDDFLYLFNRSEGTSTVSFYKFLQPPKNKNIMTLMSTGQIVNPYISSAYKELECLHLVYSGHLNSVFIFRKYFDSPYLSITEMFLKDDYINYKETQTLELLSITGKSLFFRTCHNLEDEDETVRCIAFDLMSFYVISFNWNGNWKFTIEHNIALLYTIAYPWDVPISHINNQYLAIINNTETFRDELDIPAVIVYKLGKDKNEIFGVLSKSDFDNNDQNFKTKLMDVKLSKNPKSGKTYMHVASISSLKADKKELRYFNYLNIFKFEMNHFQIEYNLENMSYTDSLTLNIYDPIGRKETLDLNLVIVQNAKIFMYVIINIILFLVFVVLCIVTFCIYRKKKLERLARLDSSMMSNDSFDQSKSFAI
jgi:hypothetical protein